MARPIYPQRGEGPAGGLADGAVGTSEIAASAVTTAKINDSAVTQPKIAADAAGLTAVSLPVVRRTTNFFCEKAIAGATNYNVFRAGAEAPRITGCYVNMDVQMYHAAAEADTWIFQLRNTSRGLNLVKNNASLSGVTLAATAWKSLPMNNGNSTLNSGEGLQFQLTESGTAQTLTNMRVLLEWEPTVNT